MPTLDPNDYLQLPWGVGRKVPNHIYVQRGVERQDSDIPFLTLPTPELARHIARAHNLVISAIDTLVKEPE